MAFQSEQITTNSKIIYGRCVRPTTSFLSESWVDNVLWTGLNQSNVAAYNGCIDATKGSTGLSLRVESATASDVTLLLRWTPPITWSGISVPSSKQLPTKVTQGSGVSIIVVRPQTEQALAVNWKGESGSVTLTPMPPPLRKAVPKVAVRIVIAAVNFTSSKNVKGNAFPNLFGPVLTNDPPGTRHANMAEWKFQAVAGDYSLSVEYASAEWRPVDIFINEPPLPNAKNVLGTPTGCWMPQCQHVQSTVNVTLVNGENTIRIESPSIFPHIRTLFFDPIA